MNNDEVSYVVHWDDMSSMNSWHIMSYQQGIWKELYSFIMWDWQLPEISDHSQGNPARSETFSLVRKMGPGKIRVIYNNEGEEDSMIVRLK